MSKGNIEECFTKDAIRELTDNYPGGFTDADFWDGDETDEFSTKLQSHCPYVSEE
jgi:ribosomal protein S17E